MLIQLGRMNGHRVRFQISTGPEGFGLGFRAFGYLWTFKTPKAMPYFHERHSEKVRWIFRFGGWRLFGYPDEPLSD